VSTKALFKTTAGLHSQTWTRSFRNASDLIMFSSSTNVLWIRNCSAYREPMTSHALGGLTGSQRTLLHMCRQLGFNKSERTSRLFYDQWTWRFKRHTITIHKWHTASVTPSTQYHYTTATVYIQFLQRVSIACYAERCISYDRFCPTVWPSDRLSQSGIMPKRLQLRSCGLH